MTEDASSLILKIFRLVSMAIAFEILGLLGAILFAWGISWAIGSDELKTYPWSVVLAVDFFIIVVSAGLAEIAVPSSRIETRLADLMFDSVTSFIVAISTLA